MSRLSDHAIGTLDFAYVLKPKQKEIKEKKFVVVKKYKSKKNNNNNENEVQENDLKLYFKYYATLQKQKKKFKRYISEYKKVEKALVDYRMIITNPKVGENYKIEKKKIKSNLDEIIKNINDNGSLQMSLHMNISTLSSKDEANEVKIFKDEMQAVVPGIYISGWKPASDKKYLKTNKITHIIVAVDTSNAIRFPNDFKYLNIKCDDNTSQNMTKFFKETNEFINNALNTAGNVLIHCGAGISRSTTILAAYLISEFYMSSSQAVNMCKKARPFCRPNDSFLKQLKDYHHNNNMIEKKKMKQQPEELKKPSVVGNEKKGSDDMATNILFLFCDAGEYNCLKPVMEYLLNTIKINNNNINMHCNAIVIDNGSCPQDSEVRLLSSYKGFEFVKEIKSKHEMFNDRTESFNKADELAQLMTPPPSSNVKKNILITGSISNSQLDIGKAFYKTGQWYCIAFRDGYYSFNKTYGAAFLSSKSFHEIWFTCKASKQEAEELIDEKDHTTKLNCSGDINMLSWRHETNKLTNEEMFNIRSYAYGATSTSSNSICVLYYGGYVDTLDGDNSYSDSVTMFAKAAAATNGNIFKFAFIRHPGIKDTKFEEEIFRDAGVNVKILDRSKYSTAIFTKVSDLSVSHSSTCSSLSVSIGVPSCFVGPPSTRLKSPGVFARFNLISFLNNSNDLNTYFAKKQNLMILNEKEGNDNNNYNKNDEFSKQLNKVGIPKYPVQRAVRLIEEIAQTELLMEKDTGINVETFLS